MLHDERTYSPSFAYFWASGLIYVLLCVWIMNLMFNRLILASWWEDVFSFICSYLASGLSSVLLCVWASLIYGSILLWFLFLSIVCLHYDTVGAFDFIDFGIIPSFSCPLMDRKWGRKQIQQIARPGVLFLSLLLWDYAIFFYILGAW